MRSKKQKRQKQVKHQRLKYTKYKKELDEIKLRYKVEIGYRKEWYKNQRLKRLGIVKISKIVKARKLSDIHRQTRSWQAKSRET